MEGSVVEKDRKERGIEDEKKKIKKERKSSKSSKHGDSKKNGRSGVKRIQAELKEILLDPPEGIMAAPKENNIFEWEAEIDGPEDSPYTGGKFFLDIHFPEDYPFQPPKITFRTRIYHCNINSNGVICLDTIKNNWSPALTISKVLLTIMQLLSEPNPADPLVKPIAHEMLNNPENYFKTAKEWTKKYASPELAQ